MITLSTSNNCDWYNISKKNEQGIKRLIPLPPLERRKLDQDSLCKDCRDHYRGCASQLLANVFAMYPVTVPEVFVKVKSARCGKVFG